MISPAQIRAARALLSVKQSELAAAAGISLATLNNIERGIADPRSSTLEAIERALREAGVEVEEDGVMETVRLQVLARPSAHDTFFASQRVLEALSPRTLLQPQRVLFYARRSVLSTGPEDRHRIAILVEGKARNLLFDQVEFTLANSARVAEVAGILFAARTLVPGRCHYLDTVLDDSSIADLGETIRRLRARAWPPLDHPRDFLDVFDDWDGLVARHAARPDHPLSQLVAALGSKALRPGPEHPAAPDAPGIAEEPALPSADAPPYGLLRTDAQE